MIRDTEGQGCPTAEAHDWLTEIRNDHDVEMVFAAATLMGLFSRLAEDQSLSE